MSENKAFKCANCGGNEFSRIGLRYKCAYCNAIIDAPKEDVDVAELNIAISDRNIWNFDEALERYNHILEKSPDDETSNWGAFLCFYGITFEKDSSGEFIPTCHRTVNIPVEECRYFEHLSQDHKVVAGKIEKLRQDIIQEVDYIEDRYDVFICFKQTKISDNTPTVESKWASDIYHYLTYEMHLNVFYSEKSLVGHTGNFEPRIYSALRSSRLMLVLGASKENIESRWLKNEWKRFLKFKEEDSSKSIIGIYSSEKLDASSFPYELQKTQLLDHDSLDFKQNLTNVVNESIEKKETPLIKKKILDDKKIKPVLADEKKRIEIARTYLENERFERAIKEADGIIEENDTSADAHLIKFLALNEFSELKEMESKFESNIKGIELIDRIYSYGSEKQKKELLSAVYTRIINGNYDEELILEYLGLRQNTEEMDIILSKIIRSGNYGLVEKITGTLLAKYPNEHKYYFARFLASHEVNNLLDLIAKNISLMDDENYHNAVNTCSTLITIEKDKLNMYMLLEEYQYQLLNLEFSKIRFSILSDKNGKYYNNYFIDINDIESLFEKLYKDYDSTQEKTELLRDDKDLTSEDADRILDKWKRRKIFKIINFSLFMICGVTSILYYFEVTSYEIYKMAIIIGYAGIFITMPFSVKASSNNKILRFNDSLNHFLEIVLSPVVIMLIFNIDNYVTEFWIFSPLIMFYIFADSIFAFICRNKIYASKAVLIMLLLYTNGAIVYTSIGMSEHPVLRGFLYAWASVNLFVTVLFTSLTFILTKKNK